MSSLGEPVGGEPAPPAGGGGGVRPAPANAGGGSTGGGSTGGGSTGGATGGSAGPTRPLKLPELTERGSDA
jgi:hypothetical protein